MSVYSRCHALVSQDLHSTVHSAFVFMCLQPLQKETRYYPPVPVGGSIINVTNTYLHPRLDDVQWGVSKHAGCSRDGAEGPRHQRIYVFTGVVA